MNLSPETSLEQINLPSVNFWQAAWRRFKKNYLAMAGFASLALLVAFAFLGPFFIQQNYYENNLSQTYAGFSIEHPFGTDVLGRDIMARLMFGGRVSLGIGFISVIINLGIGVLYGGISGYLGGAIDNIMMRIVDIVYSVPDLLYVILLMVSLGNGGLKHIVIVLGIVNWMAMARIVRGQILALRQQEYVLAARALGAGPARLLLKHLLPNAMGPIIVTAVLQIPAAIFFEAFLSFVGLGIQPPLASWGSMASEGRMSIPSYPQVLLFPAGAIAITILAFNLVGDGLRDAFDPKTRSWH